MWSISKRSPLSGENNFFSAFPIFSVIMIKPFANQKLNPHNTRKYIWRLCFPCWESISAVQIFAMRIEQTSNNQPPPSDEDKWSEVKSQSSSLFLTELINTIQCRMCSTVSPWDTSRVYLVQRQSRGSSHIWSKQQETPPWHPEFIWIHVSDQWLISLSYLCHSGEFLCFTFSSAFDIFPLFTRFRQSCSLIFSN